MLKNVIINPIIKFAINQRTYRMFYKIIDRYKNIYVRSNLLIQILKKTIIFFIKND